MNSIRLCGACKLEEQMHPETVMESPPFIFTSFFLGNQMWLFTIFKHGSFDLEWLGRQLRLKLLMDMWFFLVQVQQSEALLKKIQCSALAICQILCRLLQSSPDASIVTIVQVWIELEYLCHSVFFLTKESWW